MSQPTNSTQDETQLELSAYADFGAFEVSISEPIRLTGTYIVFVGASELIFIRNEVGSSPLISGVLHLLGPLGGIIVAIGWLQRQIKNLLYGRKDTEKETEITKLDPYELLQSSPHNFKLHVSEIRSASVHPASFWSFSQSQAGRIDFAIRFGEQLRVEFAKHDELATALHLLKPLLHSALEVNVKWNPAKQRFERKRQKM